MKKIVLALIVCLWACRGEAQPAYDSVYPGTSSFSASTITISGVTCAGSNTLLVVHPINYDGTSPSAVSSITFDTTQNLAVIDATNTVLTFATNFHDEGWSIVAPHSGAHSVVITWAASNLLVGGTAICYKDVNQSTPFGTAAKASGHSTTASVTVSSATGETVIDGVFVNGSSAITSSQTARYDVSDALPAHQGGSDTAGAASVAMTESVSSANDWGIWGVSLKPVGGATARPCIIGGGIICDEVRE